MRKLTKILLVALLFRLFLAFTGWHPDVRNHMDWGIRFWEYGPEEFYSASVWNFTWPNQPPGTIYIFALVRKLYEFIFGVFWQVNIRIPVFPSNLMFFFDKNLYPALLKLPAILADLGVAYLIYKLVIRITRQEKPGIFAAFLWLVNPIVWYNSSVWGQYDSVVNFLVFLAFFLLLEKKLTFSLLAFGLSLYIKASLLIFLPIFAIVAFRQKYKSYKYAQSIFGVLLLVGLLTLPFSRGEPFIWLFRLYQDKVFFQQMQVITANAFNFWGALTGLGEISHLLKLGPLSYKTWGYILFSGFFLPTLWFAYKKKDEKTTVWSLAITAFASFMFLTNMHERYLYPLFPYLTILVAINEIPLVFYFLISLVHLLNLYNFWWFPRIGFLINMMSAADRLVPRILGFSNFILFGYLLGKWKKLQGYFLA